MFEKRQNGSSRTRQAGFSIYPAPDADGVRRIIPIGMWDGQLGDQLRSLGLSTNGANNIIPDQLNVEKNFDRKYSEQTAFFDHYNLDPIAGVKMIPFAMLPWALWQKEHAEFLLQTCELYPVEAWNTMMLPEDATGAMTLDLVAHPRGYPREYITGCNNVIGEVRDEFAASSRAIEQEVRTGNAYGIERRNVLVEHTRHNVVAATSALAAMLLTEKTYLRHQALFGHLF